jgi:hypothetical protein
MFMEAYGKIIIKESGHIVALIANKLKVFII